MFFGIFSSIIPYLIAAGVYVLYLLFSFFQPSLVQESDAEQGRNEIVILNDTEFPSEDSNRDYFLDTHSDNYRLCYNTGSPFYYDIPDPYCDSSCSNSSRLFEYPADYKSSVQILTELFFRPPPVC